MKVIRTICLAIPVIFNTTFLFAQDTASICKVITTDLEGSYQGDCKKGLAHGKGEAKGINRYVGAFKNGMPNGKGIYYYENSYHSGSFQDGLKEGKGEFHYLKAGAPDSVVKGYWSGNEYKGKSYQTYTSDANTVFDMADFVYSEESGNSIYIDIITTSGNPDGTFSSGNVLSLVNLISLNGDIIGTITRSQTTFKSTEKFDVHKFPAMLLATFSNGRTVNFTFYKAADWRVRLTMNR